MEEPRWFTWMQEILAISRAGMTYTENEYDRMRFLRLREIAAEIGAHEGSADIETVKDIFTEEVGYQTPKIDERGAVFKDGKILLVRENLDAGRWSLPGGMGGNVAESWQKH
jgi:hypothetical protein